MDFSVLKDNKVKCGKFGKLSTCSSESAMKHSYQDFHCFLKYLWRVEGGVFLKRNV